MLFKDLSRLVLLTFRHGFEFEFAFVVLDLGSILAESVAGCLLQGGRVHLRVDAQVIHYLREKVPHPLFIPVFQRGFFVRLAPSQTQIPRDAPHHCVAHHHHDEKLRVLFVDAEKQFRHLKGTFVIVFVVAILRVDHRRVRSYDHTLVRMRVISEAILAVVVVVVVVDGDGELVGPIVIAQKGVGDCVEAAFMVFGEGFVAVFSWKSNLNRSLVWW